MDSSNKNFDFFAHSEEKEDDNTFVLYNKDSSEQLTLDIQGTSFTLIYEDANDNPYTIPQDNIIEIVQHNTKLYVFLPCLSSTWYVQYIVLHNLKQFEFFNKLEQVHSILEVSDAKLKVALRTNDIKNLDDLLKYDIVTHESDKLKVPPKNFDFLAYSESQKDNTFVLYNKDSSEQLTLIIQDDAFMLQYKDAKKHSYTIPSDNIMEIVQQRNPKRFKKADELNTTWYVFLYGLSHTLHVQYIVLRNVGEFKSNFFEKLKDMNGVFEVSSNKLAMALNTKDVDEFDNLLEAREKMQKIIEQIDEIDEPGGDYRLKLRFR